MIISDNNDAIQGQGTTSATNGASGQNAEERMKAFFANPVNAVLYPVGQLLTVMVRGIAPVELLEKVYGFYKTRKDVGTPADLSKIDANMRLNYAQVIASGDEITLTSIPFHGVKLPLQDGGLTLSLATIGAWKCPACNSAHGSGIGPSDKGKGASVRGLMSNQWFYRPADKALFVISKSCFENYVQAVGQRTPARFDVIPQAVALPVAMAQAVAPVEETREAKRAKLDAPRK